MTTPVVDTWVRSTEVQPPMWCEVGAKVAPDEYGALAFETVATSRGRDISVINAHLVDHHEAILSGVMSHPEAGRLFPELAGDAREPASNGEGVGDGSPQA